MRDGVPAALFANLPLPSGVAWAVTLATDDATQLYPVERAAIARAIPARRAEFTGGRIAARRAMARLGLKPAPIPMGADRAPQWPDGVLGSISHAHTVCAAIMATTTSCGMMGLDLEIDAPLPPELAREIAGQGELRRAGEGFDKAALHIFSAKEAVYKAVYPAIRRVIGFDAIEVRFTSESAGVAMARRPIDGWPAASLPFVQAGRDGWLVTVCTVAHHGA